MNPQKSLLMLCPPLKQKGPTPVEDDLQVSSLPFTDCEHVHVIDVVRSEHAWPVRAHIELTIDNNRL